MFYSNCAKSIAVEQGADSVDNFSDDAFRHADVTCYRSRTTLILISPDLFLSLAKSGTDQVKMSRCQNLFDDDVKFSDLPLLTFHHDGNGNAVIDGHEGRHRVLTLKSAGKKLIPVRLRSLPSQSGMSIRWGSQDGGFDSLFTHQQLMPTSLLNEDRNEHHQMPNSISH